MNACLDYAESQLGVKEMRGDEHHPAILGYLATTTLGNWARSRDETPWCSAFINACEVKGGHPGTGSALASSWRTYGSKVELEDFEVGDVLVIKHKRGRDRRTGSAGGYHVGYPYRFGSKWVVMLGGNQSDAVTVRVFPFRTYDMVALRRYV